MITYGLVKQIGPYARDYSARYKVPNTETIIPKYPYSPIVGTGEPSKYAARLVQDKDGKANPKLRSLKYKKEQEQYAAIVQFNQVFSTQNVLAGVPGEGSGEGGSKGSDEGGSGGSGEGSEELYITPPMPGGFPEEPVATLEEVLARSVSSVNELLSQRGRVESLRDRLARRNSEVFSDFGQFETYDRTSARDVQSVDPNLNVRIPIEYLTEALDEFRQMDLVLAATIFRGRELAEIEEEINTAYEVNPDYRNVSRIVRELINERTSNAAREILQAEQNQRNVQTAVAAAGSGSVNPNSYAPNMMTQSINTALGRANQINQRRQNIRPIGLQERIRDRGIPLPPMDENANLYAGFDQDAYEREIENDPNRIQDYIIANRESIRQEYYPELDQDDLFGLIERAMRDNITPWRNQLPNYSSTLQRPPAYPLPPGYPQLLERIEAMNRRTNRTSAAQRRRLGRGTVLDPMFTRTPIVLPEEIVLPNITPPRRRSVLSRRSSRLSSSRSSSSGRMSIDSGSLYQPSTSSSDRF